MTTIPLAGRSLFILALSLVLFASDAHAQLGGVISRARRAAQEATQERKPERPTPPTSRAATDVARPASAATDEPLAPTGAMPVSASGYAPGVDMWDWLKKLAYLTPGADGSVSHRNYAETRVVFPVPDARYQAVVRDASGAVVTFQDLDLEVDRNLSAFAVLELRNSPENRGRPPFTAAPGTYRFAITAEGHEIGAMPVEVAEEGSDDPFDSRSTVYVTGPWKDLAVFGYEDDEDGLEVTFWISSSLASEDGARLHAHLYSGSERLTDDRARLTLWESRPGWTAHTKGLYKERGQLSLSDLADGDYRVEVAEEGRAPARTYRFRVDGGQIVPHSRSALDYAPRTDFLTPSRGAGDLHLMGIERLVWIEAE